MAAEKTPKQRAPRRHWPAAEKHRIVELTLRAGGSARAVAREYGVHANTLGLWKALYRAGKLGAPAQSAPRGQAPAAAATFVPIDVIPAVRRQPTPRPNETSGGGVVVQLVLASGATLRIESDALDGAFVCALVAELRR